MKKAFVRFYDQENLGDDLFLQMLVDRYANTMAIRRSYSSGRFMPIGNISIKRESYFVSLVDRILSRIMRSRFVVSLPAIRKYDLMIYIGGSLFMETHGPVFWERERKYYEHLKIPYYILGSNVGPVQTERFIQIMQGIFKSAKDVCFRDSASYEMFRDIPSTRVATDIVFALNTDDYNVKTTTRKRAVISVIDGGEKFDQKLGGAYDQSILRLIDKFLSQGYDVMLMSFCRDEGDERAIERIVSAMSDAARSVVRTYFYRGNLQQSLSLLAESEVIIASRFHALILGLVFGKKVLPMAYSDKTLNVLRDIKFQGPVIDIRKIDDFNWSEFNVGDLVVNNVDEQRRLADTQFLQLDKIMERKS